MTGRHLVSCGLSLIARSHARYENGALSAVVTLRPRRPQKVDITASVAKTQAQLARHFAPSLATEAGFGFWIGIICTLEESFAYNSEI